MSVITNAAICFGPLIAQLSSVKDESSNRSTPTLEELPISAGQVIGERYRIGAILGAGGMGVVCSATHVLLGTPVAVKIIHSDLKHDEGAVQRFVNEARASAALKGEHIARVFDVGQLPGGEPYLVMEQLEGVGLDDYLRDKGALGLAEAVDILLQACEGLAEAHAVALVHRDIKPANLFLARRPDGQYSLKILDFGIAKRLVSDAAPRLTDPGKSLGSPWYMSPEQMLSPSLVDQRSDVWSLGVLLFELLTATFPFDGQTVPQVCASVLTLPPPLLSERRDDLPLELDDVVRRCLEKKPEQRFADVAALADALLPFSSGTTAGVRLSDRHSSPPPYRSERAPRRSRRQRPWLGSVVAALIVVAALAGWALWQKPGLARQLGRTPLAFPWDAKLRPDSAPSADVRIVAPPVLQPKRQLGQAVQNQGSPEPNATSTPEATPTPEEARARAERYESWLRSQGLTRIDQPPAPSTEPTE